MVLPFSQSFSRQSLYGKLSIDLRGRTENAILEFLYPPHTLALFKKLSTYRLDRLARRATRLSSRLFSSTSIHNGNVKLGLRVSDLGDTGNAIKVSAEDRPLVYSKEIFDLHWIQKAGDNKTQADNISPREKLLHQLQIPIRSPQDATRFDQVWESYHKLNQSDQDFELATKMMSFLSFSSREDDRVRFLLLMKGQKFPESHGFWKAILLSVHTRKFDRAMEFYDMAVSHGSGTEVGSDIILAHAIWNRDWGVARNIFEKVIKSAQTYKRENDLQQILFELWKTTTILPDIASLATHYIQQAALVHGKKDPFAYQLASVALAHCTVPDSLNALLPLLRFHKLESVEIYESSLGHILNYVQKYPKSMKTWHRVVLQKLWSSYRIYCKPGEITKPLIHDLLSILTKRSIPSLTWEAEDRNFITDILSVCADDKIPLPYEFMVRLMEIYARNGNLDAVRLLEDNMDPKMRDLGVTYRSKEDQRADLRRMWCLLRVHVERRDIANVQAEFESIIQQFPRAKTARNLWHQVIDVYSKSGMVQEAFRVALVEMPAAGALPTRQTMLQLLWLCGWSGDTSAVLAVLNIAEQNNIPLDEWMVRRLIHAYIKSHPGAVAEEIAELMISHQINKETWSIPAMTVMFNELLVIIASRRDLRSANRIYIQMVQDELPISEHTFWALAKLLCNLKETDQATRLVKDVMPAQGMAPTSSFYSQLMRGYAIEKRWENVLAVHEEMVSKRMPSNTLSQTKYLEAVAMLNRTKPEKDLEVLTILKRLLMDESIEVYWSKEDPPIWWRHYTDPYFYHLMDAYCDIGANEMVQAIQQIYWDFQKRENLSGDPPLGILKSFMKAAMFSGQHDVVADFWQKSVRILKEYVKSMASTFKQASNMASTGSMVSFNDRIQRNGAELRHKSNASNIRAIGNSRFDELKSANPSSINPAEPEELPESQVSVAHLLSRHIGWYVQSLSHHGKFKTMINTVRDLQSSGFKLTSQAWNVYIITLCRSTDPNDLMAAFRATEVHLMPNYIPHFHLKEKGDKPLYKAMVQRQRRALTANYQLYLNSTTINHLKDIYESSSSATVDGRSVGLETEANISLKGVLESIAPTLTNVLKAWQKPLINRQALTLRHWHQAELESQQRIENKRQLYRPLPKGVGLDKTASTPILDASDFLAASSKASSPSLLPLDTFDADSDPNADLDAALLSLQGHQRRRQTAHAWRWPGEPLAEGAVSLLRDLAADSSDQLDSSSATKEQAGGVKGTLRLARLLSRAYSDVEKGQPMMPRDVVALLKKGLPDMTAEKNDAAKPATEDTFKRENGGIATLPLNPLATIGDLLSNATDAPPMAPNADVASVGSDLHDSGQLLEVEKETTI